MQIYHFHRITKYFLLGVLDGSKGHESINKELAEGYVIILFGKNANTNKDEYRDYLRGYHYAHNDRQPIFERDTGQLIWKQTAQDYFERRYIKDQPVSRTVKAIHHE